MNRDRIEKQYHDKSKTKIKAEIPYKDDKIDGVLKTYYKDGKPESETFYKDGKEQMTTIPIQTKNTKAR